MIEQLLEINTDLSFEDSICLCIVTIRKLRKLEHQWKESHTGGRIDIGTLNGRKKLYTSLVKSQTIKAFFIKKQL